MTYDKYQEQIIEYCDKLCQKLLMKYEAGAAEHAGEDPKDINFNGAIAEEVFDIIIYRQMEIVNDAD